MDPQLYVYECTLMCSHLYAYVQSSVRLRDLYAYISVRLCEDNVYAYECS